MSKKVENSKNFVRGSVQTLAFILHPTPSGFTTTILYVNDHGNDNGWRGGRMVASGGRGARPIVYQRTRWVLVRSRSPITGKG